MSDRVRKRDWLRNLGQRVVRPLQSSFRDHQVVQSTSGSLTPEAPTGDNPVIGDVQQRVQALEDPSQGTITVATSSASAMEMTLSNSSQFVSL